MAKQTFTTGQVLTAAQMTSLQQTAMGGGSATAKTVSYTLVAADAGATVIMNSASATTITVNTSLFSAGDTVFIVNQGTGVCTITAGTATVSTAGSLAMGANETGQLYFLSTSDAIFSEYTQASGGSSPLTTKGDLYGYSTTDDRVAVGTNGQVLTADSTAATGVAWATPAAGSTFVGCAAFRSGSTQSIPTGTITALTLPSEEYDSDGFHSTSSNTSRFTIPATKGGKYLVNAFVNGAANFGSLQQLVFLVNGSAYASNGYSGGVFADQRYAADWVTGYSSVISLSASDYLEVGLYHLAAGAVNAQNVRVSITYLGA